MLPARAIDCLDIRDRTTAAQFDAWLKKQGQAAPPPGGGPGGSTAAGAKLFTAQGCNSCHTFEPAKATGKIGPDLDQLAQQAERAGKPLEDFIRESIEKPNDYIEPSYQPNVMPNFGSTLKPDEIDALVQYLAKSKGAK